MKYTNFYNDYEKMLDYRNMKKEDFLKNYSYLTEEEYDMTTNIIDKNGGANSYEVSKHIIETIRKNDEILFRMSISHLMTVGISNLGEEEVENTCEDIMEEDDSHSFMTNEYKCELVRMAAQLARIDHIHLLVYIQKEVEYDVGQNEMSYERAYNLLTRCMNWMSAQEDDCATLYDVFKYDGDFTDEELKQFGFEGIIPVEEEK